MDQLPGDLISELTKQPFSTDASTQLLDQPHFVRAAPALDDFPVLKTSDLHAADRHLLPGRGNPKEFALVGAGDRGCLARSLQSPHRCRLVTQ